MHARRARRHLPPTPPHPALSCMHGLPCADIDSSQLRLPPRSIWVSQGWCCRGRCCWRCPCFARRARRDFAGAAAAFIRGALGRSQLHGCSAVLASQQNGGHYRHPAGASLSRSRCSRSRLVRSAETSLRAIIKSVTVQRSCCTHGMTAVYYGATGHGHEFAFCRRHYARTPLRGMLLTFTDCGAHAHGAQWCAVRSVTCCQSHSSKPQRQHVRLSRSI